MSVSAVIQVQAVRGALHVAAAPIGQVPLCRQTQVADLQAFLGQGLQECRGSSIYVSGVPGTGLSPLVSLKTPATGLLAVHVV